MVLSNALIQQYFPQDNAHRGKQLFEAGSVHSVENMSTERQLHFKALVIDGFVEEETSVKIALNGASLHSRCTCDDDRMCAHLAALLYTIMSTLESLSITQSPDEERRAKLNNHLQNYTVAQLRAIAKRQGWKPKGTRKSDILQQVSERILSELQNGTYLDGLAPSQAELLAAMHLAYDINLGCTTADVMTANNKLLHNRSDWSATLSGLVEYGALYRDKEVFEDEVLYRSITSFNSFDIPAALYKLPMHRASRYPRSREKAGAIPLIVSIMQVEQYLMDGKILLPNPPNWERPEVDSESSWLNEWPSRAEEITTLQDTSPFLYLAQQHHLTLPINPHVLHPESRQALALLLGNADKAEWVIDLMRTCGLIKELPEKGGYQLNSERFEQWAKMPPEAQIQLLRLGWSTLGAEMHELRLLTRDTPQWELWRTVHPSLYYNMFMADIGAGRLAVLRFLAQIAKQRAKAGADWVRLETFIRKINQVRPDFYHNVTGPEAWGFKHNGDRVPFTNSRHWEETYGQLVQHLFEGPLFWFGAVELLERNGKARAFRLTDFGRWLLNPQQQLADVVSADSQSPTQLKWVNNDTLNVVSGSDLGTILNVLNRYMSRVRGEQNNYQLDNARLEKAFSAGESVETMLLAFETLGVPLPAETQTRIRLIYQRYGSIHLYEDLTIIEFSDDFALAELRAAKIIHSTSIIHEFSPRLIAIHDAHVEKITKALHKKNHTPKIM